MAFMTGLGALLGYTSNTKDARTGTSSSTPTYTPGQTSLQSQLSGVLGDNLLKGPDVSPLRTAGTDQINKTYDSLGDRMERFTASRGFGQSGTTGQNQQQLELSRAGDIGGLESKLQGYQLDRQEQSIQDALRFAFGNPGSSSSYTTPGSATAGALSGGITALLAQLNQAGQLGGFGNG